MSAPIVDIRIVDSSELGFQWAYEAVRKIERVSEEESQNNCPHDIPYHNCPKSKEVTLNKRSDDVVKVYDIHEPHYKFLCSRKEIEKVNNKLPYQQYAIDEDYGSTIVTPEAIFSHAGTINVFDRPHPSNHDYEV
jgi:hypothetical protein